MLINLSCSCGIIVSVPTRPGFGPIETLLFPEWILPNKEDLFWAAPNHVTNVQIMMVLGYPAVVHRLSFVVDSLGYSLERGDVPLIDVLAGNSITDLKPTDCTRWTPQQQQQPPEQWTTEAPSPSTAPFSTVSFEFGQPIECRILSLNLTLPHGKTTPEEITKGNDFSYWTAY
jgi:hypothetical protein